MASDDFTTDSIMVGFVGAGKMAQAMCRGFLSAGLLRANQMTLSDPHGNQISLIKPLGVLTTSSNTDAVQNSNLIFIAVKPHKVRHVLREVKSYVTKNHVIVSVAAGVSLKSLEEELPVGTRVVRVMPNTPSLVQCGAAGFARGSHATTEDCKVVSKLFSSLGFIAEVEEAHLDVVNGISGSGPAYMFVAIEALADGGVKMGLPRDLSIKLAAQTMLGAAKQLLETGMHPAELKDTICSPGGTTIAAVAELERCGFRSAWISAVEASTKRCMELGEIDRQSAAASNSSETSCTAVDDRKRAALTGSK